MPKPFSHSPAGRRAKRATLTHLAWLWVMIPMGLQGVFAAEIQAPVNSRLLSIDRSLPQRAGFQLMSAKQTGLEFVNPLSVQRHMTNQMLLNGSGVAAGDVDQDGLIDLYFNALDGPNHLYRNLGNWQFEEIASKAGVDCPDTDATGCALADLDGDGDMDLLVNTMYRGLRWFQNTGDLHFKEQPQGADPGSGKGGMSLAIADYDLDGDLDVYVTRYRAEAMMDEVHATVKISHTGGKKSVSHFNGRPTTEPDLANRFYIDQRGGIGEYGEVDVLYRNLGGFRFEAVDWTQGTFLDESGQALKEPPRDWGLAAQFRDLNQDGSPDLYVCNDFDTPDRVWINDGLGHFQALPSHALRQTSWFSMGVDVADVNRDGSDDILVLDMLARERGVRMNQLGEVKPVLELLRQPSFRPQYMRTTLQMNRGDLTYAEAGQWAGVDASDWAWGACFLDVDLDGYEDLLISNGHERNGRDLDLANEMKAFRKESRRSREEILKQRLRFPRYASPNLALRNRGDGTFEAVSSEWGFDHAGVSHGMCLADLDQDGDLDVIINNLNEPALVYQNLSQAPRCAFQLEGPEAIGARITLLHPGLPQSQEIIAAGRYLSGDAPMRTFAWPYAKGESIQARINWPGGASLTTEPLQADRLYQIGKAAIRTNPAQVKKPAEVEPLFEDEAQRLQAQHVDPPFDDWARQPMIDHSLAHEGPAVAWMDLNEDGWEDLILSSGRTGKMGVWLNQQGRNFKPFEKSPYQLPVSRDQVSLVGWKQDGALPWLLAASSNYEDGLALGSPIREYQFGASRSIDRFEPQDHAVGPMALGDLDGDGDLDLFVGARGRAGDYPQSGMSQIYRWQDNGWQRDPSHSEILESLGMIRAACWLDIHQDGYPELILTREWDSIVLLENQMGHLAYPTETTGLEGLRGLWTGIACGDFDEDGQMDWVVGNLGLNHGLNATPEHPLELHHGLMDKDLIRDVIRAHWEPSMGAIVPDEQLGTLAQGLPSLIDFYASNRAFAQTAMIDLLERFSGKTHLKQIDWTQTTVFYGRGDHYEAIPLPEQAQWAPVSGISSGDFNGDGHLDLFLAQNEFYQHPVASRMDAGMGLLCLGNGQGQWQPLNPASSGIRILGVQRGTAAADWNQDGRLDLVVGQNNGMTHLLTNRGAFPGKLLRFRGPSLNTWAIGTQWRLAGTSGSHGPWQVIQAGSSHGSQDGTLQVAPRIAGMSQVEVCWPSGEFSKYDLTSDPGIQTLTQP